MGDTLLGLICPFFIFSPLLLFAALAALPTRWTITICRGLLPIWVGTVAFSFFHLSDADPLQFTAMFVWMGTTWVLMGAVAARLHARDRLRSVDRADQPKGKIAREEKVEAK